MAEIDPRRFAVMFQVMLLTACSYGSPKDENLDREESMPPAAMVTTGKCSDIEGAYKNDGIALSAQVVKHPRLAHSLFSLALLDKADIPRRPQLVTLALDQAANKLLIHLAGDGATRDWSTPYTCIDGWVQIVDAMDKQYIGDGVTLLRSEYVVKFAVDQDGNLVANVKGSAEYSTYLVRSHSQGNEWYKFFSSGQK